MKKILASLLALSMSTSLFAMDWDSQSLVGLEFGYGTMNVKSDSLHSNYNKAVSPLSAGIKIGAKNKNSRLFLSVRYVDIPDFDLSMMYGMELQYLMPLSDSFDIFVGANGGLVTMSFDPSNFDSAATSNTRNVVSYYAGLDAGLNFEIVQSFAIELGARYNYMDISHTIGSQTYKIGGMTQGYLSFIYKYYATK